MKILKCLAFVIVVAGLCYFCVPTSQAQISFGINIGPEPACPYGYYDYSPYNCAPYGYYGPEWFNNGYFIGSGPWFHGRRRFYGHVDNRFDPHHGYRGRFPDRGEHGNFHGYGHGRFHGNEMRGGYAGHGGDHGHGH